MNGTRSAPALLSRTLVITFATTALLLVVSFLAVTVSVRSQVRESARKNLEAGQRTFAEIQRREQRSIRLQAANLAESPTLKAAVDTYAAEQHTGGAAERTQLLNTIQAELVKVADRSEADAIVVADSHGVTLAAVGATASAWPVGRALAIAGALAPAGTSAPPAGAPESGGPAPSTDGIAHLEGSTFRVVTVPLLLNDDTFIGSLSVATRLDEGFARQIAQLARTETAIISAGSIVASTLTPRARKAFEIAAADLPAADGTVSLDDESYAFRGLFSVGDTSVYALTSIDQSARAAVADATRVLVGLALGALFVALFVSAWSARRLSRPIGQLSTSIHEMATSRRFDAQLPLEGSSLELDQLTATFNNLMASVAAAEAETEAACTAAIRGLAAALDARDPSTAGHSERVSALSVAIGKVLGLNAADLEVLRLGALLHDIGKIGVPDEVLRKPGPLTPAEYAAIKEHTTLGARIIRTIPFLARHVEIVELHHERPDGNGYPHGLKGDEIPLAARIVHVADAYDAITNARAYRPGRTSSEALREIRNGAGPDFHPDVAAALATALLRVVSEAAPYQLEVNVA